MAVGCWLGAVIVAATLCAPSAGAVVLAAGDVQGAPGQTIEVPVFLDSGGERVAGTQNDLEVSSPLYLDFDADCTVNPGIGKTGSFAVAPCDDQPDCQRVRAIVIALDNVDEIPDGSVLYRCRMTIGADAPAGLYRVRVTNGGASDPEGNALPTDGFAGRVAVGGAPPSVLQLDDVEVPVGGRALIRARLGGFLDVAEVTNEIALSGAVHITSNVDNQPSCRATAAGVTATFEFLPIGCAPDPDACTRVRATVTSPVPLPLSQPLYECSVFPVPVLAPGTYVIDCPTAGGADLDGIPLDVSCQSATLRILADGTPTPTPTRIVESATPSTATPTFTGATRATPTMHGPVALTDDDGCQVAPPAGPASIWLLIVPALLLATRLRRRF